jgi:hypothetical protein
MNEKYLSLRIVAWLIAALGWLAMAVLGFWVTALFIKGGAGIAFGFGIYGLFVQGFVALFLFALSQCIMVLVDIEYNTRN